MGAVAGRAVEGAAVELRASVVVAVSAVGVSVPLVAFSLHRHSAEPSVGVPGLAFAGVSADPDLV